MTVSLVGLLFVCVSSLGFSALDLARKILVTRVSGATLLFYLSVGQLPFFAIWVVIGGAGGIDEGYLLPAAGSVVLNLVANLLFMEAVRLSPLSLTVPFLSLTPVFTTLLGIPLLGEVPRPLQWLGVAVVVVGAFQLNRDRGRGSTVAGLWSALAHERGSLLMVLVALSWSLAMPLDKIALAHAEAPVHGFMLNLGVSAGILIALLARGRLGELKTAGRCGALLPAAILVSVVGLGFLFLALGIVWVAVIETMRRAIGSLSALLLGRWFFGEPITAGKIFGIGLMSGGVALILL